MSSPSLFPVLREVLPALRQASRVEDVIQLIVQTACALAGAECGSLALTDYEAGRLTIIRAFGAAGSHPPPLDQLAIGEGLTGRAAATGQPLLNRDTATAPEDFPLSGDIRCELCVPVVVNDRVWGVIALGSPTPYAFNEDTLAQLSLFAELIAPVVTLRLELTDRETLHPQLLQSEKLAALGEALAGIAHEINNPLTSILGHASLLGLDVVHGSVPVIVAEAQRAARSIRNLLEFSRNETARRQIADLNELVSKVVALRKFQLKTSNVQLHIDLPETASPVEVSPPQIKQLLLNLIANAEQAIPPGRRDGAITLVVRHAADRVIVSVHDNGTGIPPEARRYIFDPFFTTKSPGEGTGLGLSTAHTIAEAHRGSLQLTETSDAGTVLTLELPKATATSRFVTSVTELPAPSQPVHGRVLLVDDESKILIPLLAFLGSRELEVHHARSGQAALEAIASRSFDAVVCDYRLPDMGGQEFFQTACALSPNYAARFLFMHPPAQPPPAAAGTSSLAKPFTLEELYGALTPILQRRPRQPVS